MINLAPIKYANCFEEAGGPVSGIEESSVQLAGRRMAVANARLVAGLVPHRETHTLFGNADGTGLHDNAMTARHMAISEAVERWAHARLWAAPEGRRFGFDADPSSNGMSAFPGLFAWQARAYALREAVERYALISWWEGWTGVEATEGGGDREFRTYRICQPYGDHEVALVERACPEGFMAYGYGAGRNLAEAETRAVFELERSRFVLERFFRQNPGFQVGDLSTLPNFMERRLVYFSLPEGEGEFRRRVGDTEGVGRRLEKPEILFDGEITGPWSKYATVWRVALKMPSLRYLDPRENFFFW